MAEFISVGDLASHLDRDTADLDQHPRATSIVDRTNNLITEKWENPVNPVPQSVKDLALTVAAYAWGIDPSKRELESVSRTSDGTSRTERYATQSTGARGREARGRDVFLTDAELADLNPSRPRRRRARTIRLGVPGPY
jgi:hypothetical protein